MKFVICSFISDDCLKDENTSKAVFSLDEYKQVLFDELNAESEVFNFNSLLDITVITDYLVKRLGLENLANSLSSNDIVDLLKNIK